MVSVWFVCNSCGSMSYRTVDEFLEHKKQKHFSEFQKIRCILFEDIKSDEIVQLENAESLTSKLNSNIPFVPKPKLKEHINNEKYCNHHHDHSSENPVFQEDLQQHRLHLTSCDSGVETTDQGDENPNRRTNTNTEGGNNSLDFIFDENNLDEFEGTLSESEINFDHDTPDTFIEPKVEITVLDDDIDVDLNVNGAAWGESTATSSTPETRPETDAAYDEFLLRYSPFVPLKRLTRQEIEDATAALKLHLNNSIDPLGRQLLEVRNQNHIGNIETTSPLNSTGTGSRFLDDRYQVNLNDEGHIFFTPNILHQNVDLGPFDETFIVCSLCKFATDSKVSLKNHMKIHSKALMCSHMDCFASFDTRPLLQQHYSGWHSPLKRYRCFYADCYKAYAWPTDLKIHSLDHSGERPFRCTQENCSAEFKTKKQLGYHTSSAHSNARPFKCPKKGCASAFAHPDYLVSHLRKHPTKKYSCPNPNCRKIFLGWLNLKKHRMEGCSSEMQLI